MKYSLLFVFLYSAGLIAAGYKIPHAEVHVYSRPIPLPRLTELYRDQFKDITRVSEFYYGKMGPENNAIIKMVNDHGKGLELKGTVEIKDALSKANDEMAKALSNGDVKEFKKAHEAREAALSEFYKKNNDKFVDAKDGNNFGIKGHLPDHLVLKNVTPQTGTTVPDSHVNDSATRAVQPRVVDPNVGLKDKGETLTSGERGLQDFKPEVEKFVKETPPEEQLGAERFLTHLEDVLASIPEKDQNLRDVVKSLLENRANIQDVAMLKAYVNDPVLLAGLGRIVAMKKKLQNFYDKNAKQLEGQGNKDEFVAKRMAEWLQAGEGFRELLIGREGTENAKHFETWAKGEKLPEKVERELRKKADETIFGILCRNMCLGSIIARMCAPKK